jgi:hypothetical protein
MDLSYWQLDLTQVSCTGDPVVVKSCRSIEAGTHPKSHGSRVIAASRVPRTVIPGHRSGTTWYIDGSTPGTCPKAPLDQQHGTATGCPQSGAT